MQTEHERYITEQVYNKPVLNIKETQKAIKVVKDTFANELATDVFFITTQELEVANAQYRMKYDYHKQIADNTLRLTIGGGIGQSRLSMLILEKAHIGEVQVSLWPEEMIKECKVNNIEIL
ncbi:MAG: hypothetical protein KBT46_01350 [Ruminococcus sp.]|nr:hypothetical protein [Candidatus Copronaster equi]